MLALTVLIVSPSLVGSAAPGGGASRLAFRVNVDNYNTSAERQTQPGCRSITCNWPCPEVARTSPAPSSPAGWGSGGPEAGAAGRARWLLVRGRRRADAPRRRRRLPPARRAHPALLVGDLAGLIERGGLDITWDDEIPGVVRGYVADPFGNRIELVQALMRRIRYQEIADELRAGGGRRGGGVAAAERGRAVAALRAPAGSRFAGRWSCCATTAWSPPARASAGSSPPNRCASTSSTWGRSRISWTPAGSTPSGKSSSSPSSRRRRGCGASSSWTRRAGAARRAAQPGRRRAVRRRHRVVPCGDSASACRATTSSAGRSTSCSASRCAARPRRSVPMRRRRRGPAAPCAGRGAAPALPARHHRTAGRPC